jgi:hypothetical protein
LGNCGLRIADWSSMFSLTGKLILIIFVPMKAFIVIGSLLIFAGVVGIFNWIKYSKNPRHYKPKQVKWFLPIGIFNIFAGLMQIIFYILNRN